MMYEEQIRAATDRFAALLKEQLERVNDEKSG